MGNCTHEVVCKDMCGLCGADLKKIRENNPNNFLTSNFQTASVPMVHHVPQLLVSDRLAQEIGRKDKDDTLKKRKLILLVDLDQTIIHTTNQPYEVDPNNPANKEVIYYDLYGKILVNFMNFIFRDEIFSSNHKTSNMKSLFPCGEQLIAIIDDRADVWQYANNLLQVSPYKFFEDTGDINAPPNCLDSLDERKRFEKSRPVKAVESDNDVQLQSIEKVLEDIHKTFYHVYDERQEITDLKSLIAEKKNQVLDGCRVVFSGIVPLGMNAETHPFFMLCSQYGAIVDDDITKFTTHVIASRWGTSKVKKAEKMGIFVVSALWVYKSVENWEKVDEKNFLIAKDPNAEPDIDDNTKDGIFSYNDEIGDIDLKAMEDEVNEAISEGEDEDEEDSIDSIDEDYFSNNILRKRSRSDEDEDDEEPSSKKVDLKKPPE
ncbi:RNA polymerase II subunit A C-terminal domain phosphatase [Strongyloides ratti]|uniref:protein-serine/threonine phosphatase n=1 Tax=Strongyloides ratti TaxID=34506 RepID=A0A090LDL1_STRRB|nr:RNA polymerase II subunit A C-terminal domain phosphatase [Strongyloides ratti]CEF65605.1 RNA polymerase II subunit A C-terminal domain phosphatase [Strongyloides ratti]